MSPRTILTNAVIDRMVVWRAVASPRAAIVANGPRSIRNLFIHDRAKRFCSHVRNVMRPNLAAALNKREHGFFTYAANVLFVPLAGMLVALFAANIRFVKLNRLTFATKRASRVHVAHAFANAMSHKPRRLVRQAHHAVKLMRAPALLAGAHQMRRQKPFRHRDVRSLVNRADRCGEFLPTVFAVIPARSHRFAAQGRYAVERTAERAINTLRPADSLKVLPGSFQVSENRVRKINGRGHGLSPRLISRAHPECSVKVIIPLQGRVTRFKISPTAQCSLSSPPTCFWV